MQNMWTDAQRNAIFAKGGNLLVSAAAGSGKTAVMVQRIVELISDPKNNVNIDEILVVTFSNASADEMKRRILKSLNEIYLIKADTHVLKQIQLFNKSKISTIHSFCFDIVKENFNLLGFSPDVKIANQLQLESLKLKVLKEIIESEYILADESFFNLTELFSLKNDKNIEGIIIKLRTFIESLPFERKWFEDNISRYQSDCDISDTVWSEYIYNDALFLLESAEIMLCRSIGIIESDEQLKNAYLDTFKDDLVSLYNLKSKIEQKNWDSLFKYLSKYEFPRLKAFRNCQDEYKRELVKGVRAFVKDIISDLKESYFNISSSDFNEDQKYLSEIIVKLFSIVKNFNTNFEHAKLEHDVVSFNDLEKFTLKILVSEDFTPTKYSSYISDKYKQIFIDEYQDTNEIQDVIFTCLSQNKDNLFMVGDVKQSIYKFRQAKPQLFVQKLKTFNKYDEKTFPAKIILDKNFRSTRQVIDFVNQIFKSIMTEKCGEVDYDESQMLVCSKEVIDCDSLSVDLHILDISNFSGENKRKLEARYIANKIKDMIRDQYMVEDNGRLRPCQPKDFCILLRTVQENKQIYCAELEKCAVPVDSSSSESYFKTNEIAFIINFLKVIYNPLQDVPLLGILISPAFNLSTDDIASIRAESKDQTLYHSLSQAIYNDNCVKAFELLREIIDYSKFCTLFALVQKIYDTFDVLSVFSVIDDGKKRVDNLNYFLNYVKDYEKYGYANLSNFIIFIDECIENGISLETGSKDQFEDNAVKIMSIHKSKGLEYPICIIADCNKEFNFNDIKSQTLMDEELGLGVKIRNTDKLLNYSTLPYNCIRLKKRKEIISEEMRIFYVALTRAKQKLILSFTDDNIEKKLQKLNCIMNVCDNEIHPALISKFSLFSDWILLSFFNHVAMSKLKQKFGITPKINSDVSNIEFKVFYENKFEFKVDAAATEIARKPYDEKVVADITKNIEYEYPYYKSCNIPLKMSVTDLSKIKSKSEAKVNVRPKFLIEGGVTPSEKGTILHTFMQFADFKNARLDIELEIQRLVELKYLSPAKAKTLNRKKIIRFLESNLADKLIHSDNVYREFKFRFKVSGNEIYKDNFEYMGDDIFVQGIADCVIVENSGITIIDYKTDFAKCADDLIKTYKSQLMYYKKAIEQIFNKSVTDCVIYSLYLSKEISVDLNSM